MEAEIVSTRARQASLHVIPSLKITDRSLLDVDRHELVPLAVDELVELQPSRLATSTSARTPENASGHRARATTRPA
jgi:hypothetical protein